MQEGTNQDFMYRCVRETVIVEDTAGTAFEQYMYVSDNGVDYYTIPFWRCVWTNRILYTCPWTGATMAMPEQRPACLCAGPHPTCLNNAQFFPPMLHPAVQILQASQWWTEEHQEYQRRSRSQPLISPIPNAPPSHDAGATARAGANDWQSYSGPPTAQHYWAAEGGHHTDRASSPVVVMATPVSPSAPTQPDVLEEPQRPVVIGEMDKPEHDEGGAYDCKSTTRTPASSAPPAPTQAMQPRAANASDSPEDYIRVQDVGKKWVYMNIRTGEKQNEVPDCCKRLQKPTGLRRLFTR